MPKFRTFFIVLFLLNSYFAPYYVHAQEICSATTTPESDFEVIKQGLLAQSALKILASWNTAQIYNNAPLAVLLQKAGDLQVSYVSSGSGLLDTGSEVPHSLTDVLNSSTITISLYKGVVGSSTELFSKELSNNPANESVQIPTTFSSEGSYILTISATNSDTPGTALDFEKVISNGISENQMGSLGKFIPAAYGILPFSVQAATSSGTKVSNVLFIPGTLTSRLYMRNPNGSERDLWEPRSDLDVNPLAMNTDGTSMHTIYTRDIIDRLYSNNALYGTIANSVGTDMNVYGTFESFMNSLVKNGTIKEWRAYPYDWRYDAQDIVANGTLVGTATTSPSSVYIQSVLAELASTSPTGKVTIIAHSNGGLIAKALAIDLAAKGKIQLVDRIIFVGTPQYGTPKAITDLLHGDEFTQALGLIMYSDTVRAAEATMPGPYDLIPSPAYFAHVPTAVVSFDTAPPANLFRKTIGAALTYFYQLSYFLTDAFHLDASAGLPGSTETPIPLSSSLVQKSYVSHALLDAWVPPTGLDTIAIAGWGNLTPLQESYTGKTGINCSRTSLLVAIACSLEPQLLPSEIGNLDGDDTVVSESAVGNIYKKYYFDSEEYLSNTFISIGHKDLLSAEPIQEFIYRTLSGSTTPNTYLSPTIPAPTQSPLVVISAHSPVNILVSDSNGNKTGIMPLTPFHGIYFQKESIPGSSVEVIGEEKYVYIPKLSYTATSTYQVSVQGYETGTSTIDVDEVSSSGVRTRIQEFANIPTTASTSGSFTIDSKGHITSTSTAFMASTTSYSFIYQVRRIRDSHSHMLEIITAFVSIFTTGRIWTMVTTIFLTMFPRL